MKKTNQKSNNNLSFIDETSNVTKKVHVKKRNKELKIKQSRLRKPLQNDNLLKNYFEFDKPQLTESDLTVYKIINTTNNTNSNADTNDTLMNNNIENMTCVNDSMNASSSNNFGKSGEVSVDKIITSQRVKCNTNLPQLYMNQHACNNINSSEYSTSLLTCNSTSSESMSGGSTCSEGNSKEEQEFDDCESFLSSVSFLYK